MTLELIPALLANSEEHALLQITKLGGYSGWMQIDILDGTLNRFSNFADADALSLLLPHNPIELHLMVSDPLTHIKEWQRVLTPSLPKRAIWHIEAMVDHGALIDYCRTNNWQCGLAIGPNTKLEALRPYFDRIDEVLVLGVHPGQSGQQLIPKTLDTVRALKQLPDRNFTIGFDGGINEQNILDLKTAGVERFCLASAIFKAVSPTNTLDHLSQKLGIQQT
ncbi:MAG: hypothetical protein U0487_00550 [Patescibacteria group bacterium]